MNNNKLEDYNKKGYSCSQTVFSYFATDMGLDEKTAIKIATPFEMGMYKSEICGALSGAYMALGLKYGSNDMDDRSRLMNMIKKLDTEFADKNENLKCIDLLGLDVNTKEGMKKAIDNNLLVSVCGCCVSSVIEITEKIIAENDLNNAT